VREMLLRIRYDDRRIVAPTTSVTKEDITTRLLTVYKFPQSEALTLCVEIIWSNNRRSEYLFISSILLNYHTTYIGELQNIRKEKQDKRLQGMRAELQCDEREKVGLKKKEQLKKLGKPRGVFSFLFQIFRNL
jgi:hypothetical protein